jgi:hypothetical protein
MPEDLGEVIPSMFSVGELEDHRLPTQFPPTAVVKVPVRFGSITIPPLERISRTRIVVASDETSS